MKPHKKDQSYSHTNTYDSGVFMCIITECEGNMDA